jgi:hypothetical protein
LFTSKIENITLGITASKTVKSDISFFLYIDLETVFGIIMEGTKGSIMEFIGNILEIYA